MEKNREEWRSLTYKGHEFRYEYQVSSLGNMRFKRTPEDDWIPKKLTKLQNYNYVGLMVKERDRFTGISVGVHRLVAIHFLPKPDEDDTFVVHMDYNHRNNDYTNLKWVDQRGLTEHNAKSPKVLEAKERLKLNPNHGKLKIDDVKRLKRRLRDSKEPLYKIAREFGITHTQLNRIRKGENWGHVTIDDE